MGIWGFQEKQILISWLHVQFSQRKQVSVSNILFLFWFNDFLSKFIDFLIYLYKRTLDGE